MSVPNCPQFNTWYDDVHVPVLLKGDCVKKAPRFKLADETYHVGSTTVGIDSIHG
jgi:hypothetical protein